MNNLLPQDMTFRIDQLCQLGPVIPVLTIDNVEDAIPMAQALVEGGLPVLEVTLRTSAALKAIEAIARHVPGAKVGAGTVITPDDFKRAVDCGSTFIVSPGITTELLEYAINSDTPFLPGIQTVSEMMEGIQRGYKRFKFFPAEISGGTNTLKAFQGPVGGTWLTPADLVSTKDWAGIATLAKQACISARPASK